MGLPVDTVHSKCMTAGEPFPAIDRKTGEPKFDRSGQRLWIVPLTLMPPGEKAININVRVPGEPKGVREHQYVKVTKLVFTEFQGETGKGTYYDAAAVEPEAAGKS
jgi:hypothetical protein